MKTKITLIFLITLLSLNGILIAQVPTNGLVGYWPFSGNANDLSGNGNNGIVHNATLTTDRFGILNSAYQFVGNDNNTVSYIVANSNNLPSGNTSRTISVWLTHFTNGVPGGSGNDGHPIIAYGKPITNSANELIFFLNGSSNKYVRYGGFNNDFDLPFNYNLNTWYNLVVTFNGTIASIYINNSLLGSGNYASWNTVLDSLVIGTQIPRSRFHNGKIDDIRIYNRVLNAAEISALYNEQLDIKNITLLQNDFIVYPNPATNKITITNNGDLIEEMVVRIITIQGNILLSNTFNNQSIMDIDVSSLAEGIYLIKIETENSFAVKKLVKE